MALAKHAAAVGRIHLDGFAHKRKPKSRPRIIVADDCLNVSVEQAAAG
jgi:hypothetical protein